MEGKEWDFDWGKLQCMACQPLCTYNPPVLVSLQLEFPSDSPAKKYQTSFGSSSELLHLCPTTTLVNMDSVQFYQPPTTTGLRSDGRPTVSNLHVSTAFGKSKKASESLQDFDLIQFLDMTGPPPKESTDPLHMPAPNLCTKEMPEVQFPIINIRWALINESRSLEHSRY